MTPAQPAARARTGSTTVGELMTRRVITIAPSDSLASAWDSMRRYGLRHLPVVDARGSLVGLVSQRDLLAASPSSLASGAASDRVRLLAWARAADVIPHGGDGPGGVARRRPAHDDPGP